MSQPSDSPGGSLAASPAASPKAAASPAASPAATSPAASAPRSLPPATPPPNLREFLSPLRTAPARTPAGSPASAQSRSPIFGATPRSDEGSPGPVITPGVGAAGFLSPVATPAPRNRGARTPVSGSPSAHTPTSSRRAHRGFLGTAPAASPGARSTQDDAMLDEEGKNFIYGTDIDDAQVTKEFHRFIQEFHSPDVQDDRPFYILQLKQLWEDEKGRSRGIKFPISGSHLASFSRGLYKNLINFPTEVIPIFDRELWHITVRTMKADPDELQNCQVKVHSLEEPDQRVMRMMNPTCDIERLVSLKGIVIRCSDLMPDMQSGLFACTECKAEVEVPLSHWTIDEPTHCDSCGKNHTFQVVHNDCKFGDRQLLKLQETPEIVPDGETPQHVVIHCYDDLVDVVRPGDRIEVTGIYRASLVRPMRNWSKCSAVFRTHVDAIAVAAESKGRIESPPEQLELSSQGGPPRLAEKPDQNADEVSREDIEMNKKVRALALEVDEAGQRTIVQKLVESFAPSIWGEEDVKKGLLCQLFGGTPKAGGAASRGRTRAEINTLLCGDPSTAKSQLLQYSYKMAARAVITSGKGSSAVGLTASINKDPVTKDLILESGALVLADRGLCCIDEFDKMDDTARAVLHEAMEQQTVSVAKAGIVCSLNARTSILASANPKDSAYDPKKSVVDNINLPKNLMTRFDLIWLMLDKRNRDLDRTLAEHLVSMYSESGVAKRQGPSIEPDVFRRYVSFARRYVFPRITDESHQRLVAGYMELRNQGSSRETITATPRILESLIRISESVCKMELREEVTVADVDEAVRLIKAATYAAAVDPETGLIDMEALIVGVGAGRRKRAKEMEQLLEEVVLEKGGGEGELSLDILRSEMNERLSSRKEQIMQEMEFNSTVKRLEEAGSLRRKGKSVELRKDA